MGRYTTAPGLLILLFTAACSGTGDSGGSPPASSSATPSSTPEPAPSAPAKPSALDLPPNAKILAPVTKGEGNTDLPVFKPETDVSTIYATCTGKGRMTIVDRDAPGDDPSKIGCNGPDTIGRIFTDIIPQKLSVQIQGGTTKWTLAVVSGEHPV